MASKVVMSIELQRALHQCSQDAAPDMGMRGGGRNAKSVAEACFSMLDMDHRNSAVRAELTALVAKHDYKDVLNEAAKHVATL